MLCSATSDEALLEGLGVDIGARHRRRSKEAEREREREQVSACPRVLDV